jgi:hypothetical protein
MHLLDTNAFIEGARFYYAMDLAPAFWNWVERAHRDGTLASVSAVLKEIQSPPELVAWAKGLPPSFWLPDTVESLAAAADVVSWANDEARPYTAAAKAQFAASADLRLIAQAYASNSVVITREVSAPASQRSVKIPDVCAAFSVSFAQPFDAYRRLGLSLS